MFPLQWRDNNIGTPELADSAFSIGLRLFASSCGFYFIICRVRTSSSSSHCRGMRLWQLVLRIKQSVGMARTCSRLGIFTATSSSRRKLCRRFCLFLPRDAMQAWPIPSCGVRPSVRPSICPSVTFVDSVETNKHIFKIFPLSDSHTILFFRYQTARQYSDGNPLTGASNAGGVGRTAEIAILSQYQA